MTETSCIATQFLFPQSDATGSVGRPIPNLDMKLVDDAGNDISAYDVRGELCVRGPVVVRRYFDNPQANERDWDDEGYYHTGDIAYVDAASKLWYIVDRKKVGIPNHSWSGGGADRVIGADQSPCLPSGAGRARRHPP